MLEDRPVPPEFSQAWSVKVYVPWVVGVPESVGFVAFAYPGAAVSDEPATPKTSPGGIDPVTVHDFGGLSVGGEAESANATGEIAVPAVTA